LLAAALFEQVYGGSGMPIDPRPGTVPG
jgi:hypothetical protein